MFNKEVVVRCESGLHNKQATYFVQKANEFESSIWLESGSRKMNAKSLLGIMSLGIVTGSSVKLSAVGSDAEAAVNALEALLEQERLGALVIRRYHELPEEMLNWIRRVEADCIRKANLIHTPGPMADYYREHYPQSWEIVEKEQGVDGRAMLAPTVSE